MAEDTSLLQDPPSGDPPAGDPPVTDPPAGDPPATPPAPSPPPQEYTPFSIYEDGKVSEKFAETLGEDDRGLLKFFEKYAGSENPNKEILKGIKNLQYLAGQKGLEPLPPDAPEDVVKERNQLLAKLQGVPESPDGYHITPPDDLKDIWQPETISAFSEILHKHNASPELAKELVELQAKLERDAVGNVNAMVNKTRDEEISSLKQEHGDNFSKVIERAKDGARTLGLSDEEMNAIARTAAAVNALAKVTELVAEDKIVKSDGTPQAGGSWRDRARDIVFNPNNPLYAAYHDPNNPQHQQAVNAHSEYNRKHHAQTSQK